MFSVVIPLYNKEKFIKHTIQSVLDQTFQDFEIIIVNDGSTDGSVEVVKQFEDERIHLIEQKNAGVSAARNRGIQEAKYDLIAFLDADDEWLPNHLEEMAYLKNKYLICKVFATNYKIVDTTSKERFPVNIDLFLFSQNDGILENYFEIAAHTAPPIWTSAVVVEKRAIEKVKGFPQGIRLGEDLLVWALLAVNDSIAYSKKITAVYNFKSLSELIDSEPFPDEPDVVGKELKALQVHSSQSLSKYISLWHRMRYNLYIKNFQRMKAFNEIIQAIYFNSKCIKNYILLLLLFLPHTLRTWIMRKRLSRQEVKLP